MGQKFYASPRDTYTHPNGAIGYRPGGSFDCLGPFAKVRNCPIEGTRLRLTCYATGYANTAFSVPACTRHRGHYIAGYFTTGDDGVVFRPYTRHRETLRHARAVTVQLCIKANDDVRYATRYTSAPFSPLEA